MISRDSLKVIKKMRNFFPSCRYIFIPLGGSKKGLILQLMSSLLSFAFVYIWHGLQLPILLWTLSSFLAVTLETVGRAIVRLPSVKNCLVSNSFILLCKSFLVWTCYIIILLYYII